LIAEIAEFKVELGGELLGVGDRFRNVGEQARHFFRSFKVTLGVDGEQASGLVE
jgi:hypothetical protein